MRASTKKGVGSVEGVIKPSWGLSMACAFMAALFAYSASVQLNDIDWYFWLPLYTLACFVCLVHTFRFSGLSRGTAYVVLVGGIVLFLKVVAEACIIGWSFNWREFVSFDMEKREVREKLGSMLVWLSMGIQLDASGGLFNNTSKGKMGPQYGMLMVVSASIIMCVAYLVQKPKI